MALSTSPHYKFLEAAKAALDDARSDLGLTWKIQKLSALRGKKWSPAAVLSPLISVGNNGYENATDKITVRTLVVFSLPSELKVAEDMEVEMQMLERIEDIFRNCTIAAAPASIRALNDLDPLWKYQITRLEPADRFLAQAFGQGFDVLGTVLATDFTVARSRFDFTALGS